MRVLVIAAVLFLVGAPAAAQQPGIAIVDADRPLAVSGAPVVVEVVNNTPRAAEVSVEAAVLSPKQTSIKIEVALDGQAGPTGTIVPAGSTRVTLTALDTAVAATGWLVVRTETAVARRAITVGAGQPITDVATWSADWTRWLGWWEDTTLPGEIPASAPCAGETASTTVVSGDNTATVTASCAEDAFILTMTDVDAAGPSLDSGEYTGTLVLGESEVTVTVRRSAPILLALALLLGSTVAALGAQTWIADRRPVNLRRREVKKITPPSAGIVRTVVDTAKADLNERLKNIRPNGWWRRFPLIWLPWPDGFRATELAAIDKEIAQLTGLAARSDAYATGLATLATNRDLLAEKAPAMTERLDLLAAPPPSLTPAELAEHMTDAEHADALVDVANELDTLWSVINATADPATFPWHVEAAHLQYRVLRARVARLTRPAEVARLRGLLAGVVELADRLRPDTPPGPAARRLDAAPAALGVGTGMLDRLQRFVVGLVSGTGGGLALRDAAVAVVVVVVALWGGLSALYVGKVWGSVWDMVTAAVWGFGAVTVAAPLVTALKRVGSTRRSGE